MNQAERQENRRSWNAATRAHLRHKTELITALREGGSTLFPEDLALLGDVRGARLAHLLCNTGEDSLSLAALSAEVTGIDLSDEAIDAARDLSARSGIPASFVRSDVYRWLDCAAHTGETFNIVYSSYGVICWLDDLERWATSISRVLTPGGRLVLIEFHPVAAMFDADLRLTRSYGGGYRLRLDQGVGDYVAEAAGGLSNGWVDRSAPDFHNPYPATLRQWGLGEVVSAIAGAGLRIDILKEYTHVNGERMFPSLQLAEGWRYVPADDQPTPPLMFGLRAVKQHATD